MPPARFKLPLPVNGERDGVRGSGQDAERR
jgi:hypothetical protein